MFSHPGVRYLHENEFLNTLSLQDVQDIMKDFGGPKMSPSGDVVTPAEDIMKDLSNPKLNPFMVPCGPLLEEDDQEKIVLVETKEEKPVTSSCVPRQNEVELPREQGRHSWKVGGMN